MVAIKAKKSKPKEKVARRKSRKAARFD